MIINPLKVFHLKFYTVPIILLLWIMLSLINTSIFGLTTLTAYFGFTILAILLTLLLLFNLLRDNILRTPTYILVYFLLTIYITSYGIIRDNFNLTHYYWEASTLLLFVLYHYFCKLSKEDYSYLKKFLLWGISAIVFLESLITLAQYSSILPSANSLFTCTGTWQNPNVTAMFLSMGIYTTLQIEPKKRIVYLIIFLTLLAIVLLKCRTAYVVTLLLIGGRFWTDIETSIFQKYKLKKSVVIACSFIFFAAVLIIIVFYFKRDSANARLQIWENSIHIVSERPFTGYGFGLFEKYYNAYLGKNFSSVNDHAFMAYNDFLELAVEGGLVAVMLWTVFIVFLIRYNLKNGRPVLYIIAFLFIQLTNFGFQAIPVFALFLLYVVLDSKPSTSSNLNPTLLQSSGLSSLFSHILITLIFIVSSTLLFRQTVVAKSFNKASTAIRNLEPSGIIAAFDSLQVLSPFQWYHENYGDAYLKLKQFKSALIQYNIALSSCSNPDILSKCGWCYQQLGEYDNSEHYYSLSENIVPYMFTPRMALLLLYQQKGDTVNVLRKAEEISKMPVKVESAQVYEIKEYANKIIAKRKT